MKMKITLLSLCTTSFLLADDIEVSQDTLMQNLNYGQTALRTLTLTNTTTADVDMTITMVNQTWIPFGRSAEQVVNLPPVPSGFGFDPGHICGTPDPTPEEVLRTVAQVERWLEQQDRSSRNIVNVLVAWHVIHAENGTGSLTLNQIAQQIIWLNDAFADHDFIFTLASVDYTENDNWFNNMWDLDSEVKAQLYIDPYHHMNVYTASLFGDGVAGYAYLPYQWPEGSSNHGIVLDYRTLPYAGGGYDGDVATHEAGHYLGLQHTFYNNCVTGNDGVDDTPAHHEDYLWQCNDNLDSCPSLPGNDPVHNYMTYTSDNCQWEFTPGQKDRMHAMVATYRPSLLENPVAPQWLTTADAIITIPANGAVDVDFVFDATNTYGGTYYGDILFTSLIPDTTIVVDVTLEIIGTPEIEISASSLSFADTYVSDTSTVTLDIDNIGSDDLFISNVMITDSQFFTESNEIAIAPEETFALNIHFIPDSVGPFASTVTLSSNDTTDMEVVIDLFGEGIASPLVFSNTVISDTLEPNNFSSQFLAMANTSSSTVTYELTIDNINWLTVNNTSGNIAAGDTQLVQLNFSSLFMDCGEYSGIIIVSTNVGQFTIDVQMVVIMVMGLSDELNNLPSSFTLYENFPNPFNPKTKIRIDIPLAEHLTIHIHDISGRLINTLYNGLIEPGVFDLIWSGENTLGAPVASGIYILNVYYNKEYHSQKMLLVK